MAASAKIVEVLCPNGRRQKVKTNPSMTVFQILQQVCEKQGYADAEYDLKHQRKILNITSIMRYVNLANNAKLEMVTCEKPRIVSNVTVALQLEDGTRYQDDFNPDVTLIDVLKKFLNEIEKKLMEFEPVCIYMRNEYKGVSVLSSRSLKSIGITSGRAAIRLLFRNITDNVPTEENTAVSACIESINEDQSTIKTFTDLNDSFKAKEEPDSSLCELKEPIEKKIRLENYEVQVILKDTPESNVPEKAQDGSSVFTSFSIIGAPPSQIFPKDVQMGRDKLNEPVTSPNDSVPTRYEFADFKFPDDTSDAADDDMAIDPHLIREEVKLSMPCDREAVTYITENVQPVIHAEELDDQFFQVTVDDLRTRMSDLKSERKGTEDATLMTTAMREKQKIEKISRFGKIPVRLLLPGELTIQGIFRPLETVGAIKEFLNNYLSKEVKKCEIFTTPPKVVLKDKNQTLYDAKLFPAAVVHVSFGNSTGPYVTPECLENLSTSNTAEAIIDKILKRDHSGSVVLQTSDTGESSTQSNDASSSPSSSTSSSSNSFPKKNLPKGAPKWFKPGR